MVKENDSMSKKNNPFSNLNSFQNMLRTIGFQHYFNVSLCGNLVVGNKWKIEPRIINDFHLLLVVSGKGMYTVAGKEIPLHKGCVIFLSHGVEYSAIQDLKEPPHIFPIRFFTYDNKNRVPKKVLENPVAINHCTKNLKKYRELFESLHRQHLLNQGDFRTGYCSMMLHHILSDLFFDCKSDDQTQEDNRIVKVQQFIASNPLDRSSLHELAGMAKLSQKYFSKIFKNKTGVSPKRYQLTSRLSHAKDLLLDGYSVKETSFKLGYTDPFIFSKQFKSIFETSPNEFRKY